MGYADAKKCKGLFNVLGFNPAFHYQYQDLVLLDELEIATDENGTTETGLEFATINLLVHDYAVLYAGKFNSGIGQFRQNLHPGWINRLPSVPVGFGHDQASPATELGAGVRGAVPFGAMRATYDVWVGNGPRLNGAGDEIEMIETEGATSNADGKKVWGGRIGLFPLPKLELALSAARGDVAVVQAGTAEAARDYPRLRLRCGLPGGRPGSARRTGSTEGRRPGRKRRSSRRALEGAVCAGGVSLRRQQVGGRAALREVHDAACRPEPEAVGRGR